MSTVEKITVPNLKKSPNIYSHATKIPGLIFLSGQTPVDEDDNPTPGGIQEHTLQCLQNLTTVLETAGSSWDKVVKVNIYLKTMDDFAAMNEVYEKVRLSSAAI